MNSKYFKFNTRFRNETYDFVVKHAHNLKMTGSDIQKIVSEKFGATIPESEISYNKTEIQENDYIDSELDKHNPDIPVSVTSPAIRKRQREISSLLDPTFGAGSGKYCTECHGPCGNSKHTRPKW